jgi:hypothetical protein
LVEKLADGRIQSLNPLADVLTAIVAPKWSVNCVSRISG